MEKQKRIQNLVLRGGGDVSACGEVGQVVPNLFVPKRTRMLSPVVLDVADDPATVRFFGLVRVARSATGRPNAIQKGDEPLEDEYGEDEPAMTRRRKTFGLMYTEENCTL